MTDESKIRELRSTFHTSTIFGYMGGALAGITLCTVAGGDYKSAIAVGSLSALWSAGAYFGNRQASQQLKSLEAEPAETTLNNPSP